MIVIRSRSFSCSVLILAVLQAFVVATSPIGAAAEDAHPRQERITVQGEDRRELQGEESPSDSDQLEVDQEIWDPIEPVNRAIFSFNDTLDSYLLEPVAKGYDYVLPEFARTGVRNFFENLSYPSYLVSDLVQLKFTQAARHTGRFLLNSTVGLVGTIDVAREVGLGPHKEDFGIALAYRGVPPGPYLVLPFFGPSNLRDGAGRLVDFFLDPVEAVSFTELSSSTKAAISVGGSTLRVLSQRADLLEGVKAAKESSLDYYTFVQSSYYQYRRGIMNDGKEAATVGGGSLSGRAPESP
jgi:phospholipid-binding lipoprotein MlaA